MTRHEQHRIVDAAWDFEEAVFHGGSQIFFDPEGRVAIHTQASPYYIRNILRDLAQNFTEGGELDAGYEPFNTFYLTYRDVSITLFSKTGGV
jgi:hypothetical protein